MVIFKVDNFHNNIQVYLCKPDIHFNCQSIKGAVEYQNESIKMSLM